MKPKAVLAYCREKGIRAIDLRFADLGGDWRHVTMPASALTEGVFESGFGHEVMVLGVPNEARQQVVLVPIADAHFVDPMVEQPTLVLLASLLDAMSREDSGMDSRSVAARSVQYLVSTGIADSVNVRALQPFSLHHTRRDELDDSLPTSRLFLGCGAQDEDYPFRCQLAELATEAGVVVDRHYRAEDATSEMVLGASSLPDLCDDLMMIRYLIDALSHRRGQRRLDTSASMSTQWMFSRAGEPVLSGGGNLGLSDLGWYAIGGVLAHAATIAAVSLATPGRPCDTQYRWSKSVSPNDSESLCQVVLGFHDPRQRAIEVRGSHADGNAYLQMAAILMAMVDGIQNKLAVASSLPRSRSDTASKSERIATDASGGLNVDSLRRAIAEDSDFLLVGNVFSESLLEALMRYLER